MKIVHEESPPVGLLLDDLRGRLPGAMTRFGLDANQYRRRTRLRGLQRRGVLE